MKKYFIFIFVLIGALLFHGFIESHGDHGNLVVVSPTDYQNEYYVASQVCDESVKVASTVHGGMSPSIDLNEDEKAQAIFLCNLVINSSIQLYGGWPSAEGNPSPSYKTALTVVQRFEKEGWTSAWQPADFLEVLMGIMKKYREAKGW